MTTSTAPASLAEAGFVTLTGPYASTDEAFAAAATAVHAAFDEPAQAQLEVIGDFTIPPRDGPPGRDFQTLHLDFGLPVDPVGPGPVARCTALFAPFGGPGGAAATRLVPLAPLLAQRSWPEPAELLRRLIAYGETHGGRDEARGYVEGSFARLVEAADGALPRLPSIRTNPEFLCGEEFGDLDSELTFLAALGLSVEAVERLVRLAPGEVLLFDNLTLAHGRAGRRRPGELRQRVFGYRDLGVAGQKQIRDRVLGLFAGGPD